MKHGLDILLRYVKTEQNSAPRTGAEIADILSQDGTPRLLHLIGSCAVVEKTVVVLHTQLPNVKSYYFSLTYPHRMQKMKDARGLPTPPAFF